MNAKDLRIVFMGTPEFASAQLEYLAKNRGKLEKKLYSVPAQKWADITDSSKEFGVSIPDEDTQKINTVQDVIDYIEKLQA